MMVQADAGRGAPTPREPGRSGAEGAGAAEGAGGIDHVEGAQPREQFLPDPSWPVPPRGWQLWAAAEGRVDLAAGVALADDLGEDPVGPRTNGFGDEPVIYAPATGSLLGATAVGAMVLIGTSRTGLSGGLVVLGLVCLVVATVALVRGRVDWAHVAGRRGAGGLMGVALATVVAGSFIGPGHQRTPSDGDPQSVPAGSQLEPAAPASHSTAHRATPAATGSVAGGSGTTGSGAGPAAVPGVGRATGAEGATGTGATGSGTGSGSTHVAGGPGEAPAPTSDARRTGKPAGTPSGSTKGATQGHHKGQVGTQPKATPTTPNLRAGIAATPPAKPKGGNATGKDTGKQTATPKAKAEPKGKTKGAGTPKG